MTNFFPVARVLCEQQTSSRGNTCISLNIIHRHRQLFEKTSKPNFSFSPLRMERKKGGEARRKIFRTARSLRFRLLRFTPKIYSLRATDKKTTCCSSRCPFHVFFELMQCKILLDHENFSFTITFKVHVMDLKIS